MKTTALLLAAAIGGFATGAAVAAPESAPASAVSSASAAAGFTDGELRKIDAEQGKVTLRHGPIENLGMPGMTMVFRADAPLLSAFKPGDLVRFKADRVDGALKITELVAR